MTGPAPKPADLRQRRNRKSGAAALPADGASVKAPALPTVKGVTWLALTRAWWQRVWSSPMAGEYLETDADGLGRLAVLVNQFYESQDVRLMPEIRLQEARFGLSPVDRSRLQWEVQRTEDAGRKRKRPVAAESATDPRDVLRVVS